MEHETAVTDPSARPATGLAIVPVDTPTQAPGGLLAVTAEDAEAIRDAKAAATWRAYGADWRDFEAWCAAHGQPALPSTPLAVAAYVRALADQGFKASTIARRLASISVRHKAEGWDSPTADPRSRLVWAGVRRRLGEQGRVAPRQVHPATIDVVRRLVATLDGDERLIAVRDQCLILVGFAGGFRRSELVALDVEDLEDVPEHGLRVTLRRSKTDQAGEGRRIGIPFGSHPKTCPVRTTRAWITAAGIHSGPLFRSVDRHGNLGAARLSGRAVAIVVKRAAERAGLDPEGFAGHSLRAGLATSAAAAGVPERHIMAQTGHASAVMVRRYIREGELFSADNPASRVGL